MNKTEKAKSKSKFQDETPRKKLKIDTSEVSKPIQSELNINTKSTYDYVASNLSSPNDSNFSSSSKFSYSSSESQDTLAKTTSENQHLVKDLSQYKSNSLQSDYSNVSLNQQINNQKCSSSSPAVITTNQNFIPNKNIENENHFFNRLVSTSEKFLSSTNFNQASTFNTSCEIQSSRNNSNSNGYNIQLNNNTNSIIRNQTDFNSNASNTNCNNYANLNSNLNYSLNQNLSGPLNNNIMSNSFIDNNVVYENQSSNMNSVAAAAFNIR